MAFHVTALAIAMSQVIIPLFYIPGRDENFPIKRPPGLKDGLTGGSWSDVHRHPRTLCLFVLFLCVKQWEILARVCSKFLQWKTSGLILCGCLCALTQALASIGKGRLFTEIANHLQSLHGGKLNLFFLTACHQIKHKVALKASATVFKSIFWLDEEWGSWRWGEKWWHLTREAGWFNPYIQLLSVNLCSWPFRMPREHRSSFISYFQLKHDTVCRPLFLLKLMRYIVILYYLLDVQ